MDTKSQSRVLIVDDMRVNRMVLSSLLASNGVLTDLAESGEECLELCRKNKYDLILLDHRMPGIDGHRRWKTDCPRRASMSSRCPRT